MSDTYREILVKKKTTAQDQAKKVCLIGATVLCFVAGIVVTPLLLLAGVAMCVACYFLLPGFDLEYEYLYVNGELDIDKIMSKQKRKKCASYNMENLEILAPSNSHALDSFRNKNLKVRDFTSMEPQVPSYTLVFNEDKGQEMVKVEIDEAIVSDIRRMAPRKVCQF